MALENGYHKQSRTDVLPDQNECYLCGGPLADGNCPAYHWHDAVHRKNREQMDAGLGPSNELPVDTRKASNAGLLCSVCAAPLDADGVNCTRINAPFHTDRMTDYGYVDEEWWYRKNEMFHSTEQFRNAPPITFLIDGFLQCEAVTAIAAPVRERKTIVALNMVHALLTGEKLFGRFSVVKKPKRVIYLSPETGLQSIKTRLEGLGLGMEVGGRLLLRTMTSEGSLKLDDELFQDGPVNGAVVFLDTAIRFLSGDESSSKDVRLFADTLFTLLRKKADAVVLVHHSPKASGDTMTLENAMRGSGDFGAFVAACWGARLQDPAEPYKSTSFLSNLKQRDFQSEDLEVRVGPDFRMHYVEHGLSVPTLAPRSRFKGDRDGRDKDAIEFLRANPKMSLRDAAKSLKESGMPRGKDWVKERRFQIMQEASGGAKNTN